MNKLEEMAPISRGFVNETFIALVKDFCKKCLNMCPKSCIFIRISSEKRITIYFLWGEAPLEDGAR